jgi:phage shock protein PspC (stress-responsive transcriptional regulator)
MGARVRAFLAFCYDFVIGDDWRIAAGVAAGLAVTYAVSQTSVPSWWVMPALVVIVLPASLWRATRRR